MSIFISNVTNTLIKLLLASVLLIGSTAQAVEKDDITAVTDIMIEKNTQQVGLQLTHELNNDIQLSMYMAIPLQMNTDITTQVLIAKTATKAKNKQINSHGE